MKRFKSIPILMGILLCTFANHKASAEITAVDRSMTILTEDSGLGNRLKNGKPAGYNVEVVREILRRVGHIDNIEVFPWVRAYMMLQERPNIVLFSTTRTPERESLFKWVGPTSINTWGFYKRKGSKLQIASLEGAKKVDQIGVIRDDAKHKFLLNLGFANLYPVTVESQNLQMLMHKRIDLWIASDHGVRGETEKAGIELTEIEKVLSLRKNYLYIAMSAETPDSVVKKWQTVLNEMKKDGTYKAIMLNHSGGEMAMTFDPPQSAIVESK